MTRSSRPVVLVVDDDLAIRDMVTTVLDTDGYTVKTAADGIAALVAAEEHNPDLIVLDVAMPRMDGLTVAQKLRTRHGYDNTRIVFLSARTTDQDQWDGWRAGADSYLTKPLDIDDLLSEVNRLLTDTPPR